MPGGWLITASPIDLTSMSDGDDENQQLLIGILVDDPVIACAGYSDAPAVRLRHHRPTSWWSRVGLQVGEFDEDPSSCPLFELAYLPSSGGGQVDPVRTR